MKPHPRIRKTIKWGGAVVTVLLLVAWVGSGWWVCARSGSHSILAVAAGDFEVHAWAGAPAPATERWIFGELGSRPRWSGGFTWVKNGIEAHLPLWIPLIACGATTVVAFRFDALARHRARQNLCPNCNYDRAGIAGDAKCPECGYGGCGGADANGGGSP
jgi:hypothetical protein